ncbi:MAG: hypothetical protein EHM93_01015 [Bacteroidales bacterium]|nr:MAG: hypothetical protein EHM93_01015 [Bacteroidales bacterium]
MNRLKSLLSLLIITTFLFSSCEKDEKTIGKYENGAFITNEGAYNHTNASVSYFDFSTNTVTNDIFASTNGRPIGDVLQSAYRANGKVFFVLNNSSKVEIADENDITEIDVIEGLNSPRYLTVNGGKAYISQWGDNGKVKVVDLNTLETVKTIEVGDGPEGVLAFNNQIWVANSGGFSKDSTITIINPITNEVFKTIKLDGHCPQQMVVDKNNDVWVLCSGYVDYYSTPNTHTPSKLIKISSTTYEVTKSLTISSNQHPMKLDISSNGETVYFGAGFGYTGIYTVSITATSIPSNPIINDSFYGFNVNPKNNEIFCLKAPSFTDNGLLKRYSSTGQFIDEHTVGIGPNGILF